MVRFDDPTLMAFAEGELPASEAQLVEAELARNSALRERLHRLRGVRTALRAAYDSVANEPVPEHLRALLGDVASIEPPASAPAPRPRIQIWMIVVAALFLAVGFLIGRASLQ